MANTIILKRSSTPGKTPTTSQLALGEIAINTYDGRIFIKKDDGTPAVVEIGGVTSVNTYTGDVVLGTDDINEGSNNLYFTTARARGALSAGTGISYSSSTGVISTAQNLSTAGSPSFAGLTLTGNATARNIIPAADVTYALGSATAQWKDLYVGPGTIYVNGSPVLSTSNGVVQLGGSTNQDVNLAATGTGTLSIGAATVTGDITIQSGKQIKTDNITTQVLLANAVNMQGHLIVGLATPTGNNHAATKSYVDTAIGAISTSAISKGDSNVTVTDTGTGIVTVTVDGSTALTVDAGGVVVSGNFTVNGTTTTVNSNTVAVADNIITLNSDWTGSPTQNAGIEVNRGSSANTQIRWNEGSGIWTFTNDGSTYLPIATSTTDLAEGSNLYFTTGRARTSLSATTATGVSYNSSTGIISLGSIPNSALSNNAITINGTSVALGGTRTLGSDDITEGSTNLYFTNARARSAHSVTGTGLSYSSSTGVISSNATSANTASTVVARDASGNFTAGTITAALSGNASTATTLATARTINGVSFDGSSNITFGTDGVSEGSTNKYYTDARVKSYLGGGSFDGNIIPATDNTFNLGSPTKMWHSVYVGPGSLYINNQQVLSTSNNNIVVSADTNQNVSIQTSGTGNIEFAPTGTGTLNMKGAMVIYAGNNITSSDGNKIQFSNQIGVDSLTTKSANTDLVLTGAGTGVVKIDDDLTVTGSLTVNGSFANINVTNLSVADNLVDLNSDVISGTPTENVGFRVLRGDSTAVQLRWNESSGVWQFTNDGTLYTSIVGANATQTLTNKTIAAGSNTISGLTNSNLSGTAGITNANLANSSVTVGTTAINLGASSTTLAGLTSVTSTAFVGALTGNVTGSVSGNAGTVTNGVYTTDTGSVTNTMLAGSIANSKLSNSSVTVGTTAINLGASSTTLAGLTSVTSTSFVGALTGNASTVTNGVYTTDTGTVTNTMLAGSIANSKLSNSAVTIGSTSVSLGSTASTLAGLTSVTATSFVGALTGNVTGSVTGNADTATKLATARNINGVAFDGSAAITVKASTTNALTIGTGLTGTSFDGSSAVTVGIDSTVATLTGTQTLTNKTLTAPTITAPTVTGGLSTDTLTTSGAGTIGGNLTVTGNLTINGTTTTSNSTNTAYADSLIELHYSNGGTLLSNDGKDIGIRMHYYTTSDKNAALLLANDTQNLEFYVDGTETAGVFTGTYGTFKGAQFKSTATTGTAPFVVASTTRVTNLNAATAGNADTVTNGVYTTDTGTVTNTMLAGSIANTKLTNSSVTVGTTAISLGASSTTLAGLTSVTSTSFVGAVTGNASTATALQTARTINGVSFDGTGNIVVHTAGTGIAISGTSVAIDSTVATLTGSQTLTNKTLTLPTIGGTGASFAGSTSGTTTLLASAAAGTTTITLPATTGTLVTTGDTGSVTNTMLAGSIANSKLANSSTTIGTTAIALGASSTTLAGLTSVTSTAFVGALTGNADTATKLATARAINGVSFDGSAAITIKASTTAALTIGTGLSGTSFDGSGAVTIANTGVTSNVAGTGISVSGATGAVTIANTGVTSAAVSGTGLSINASTGGVTITSNATSANTASTIVARDASGNFTAGTITATLSGNASTATTAGKLTSATTINGVSFDGSSPVTVHTAGTGITISGTTVTNAGVTAITTNTGLSTNASATGAVTITNTGVTSIVAGTNIAVSGATGAVTVSVTGTVPTATTATNVSGGTVSATTGSFSGALTSGAHTVTGAITATGEITAYYSDANLKKDIVEIQDPIAKVMSLRGVTFRPNETALALGITDKEEVGVIAQEVEAVLPQLVTPSAFAGYKTVKYDKLTALLLEAVKAQQLQIDALKAEISKLGGLATTEL